MKTKTFTSEQVAEWMAIFHKYSTVEEYRTVLHTVRCLFDAENDTKFWDEVCEKAVAKIKE